MNITVLVGWLVVLFLKYVALRAVLGFARSLVRGVLRWV